MRVAAVVEQSWHGVPGGTATATNNLLAAITALDGAPEMVGIAARHRVPAMPEFAPPVPVCQLRLPRQALYAGWLWARRPDPQRCCGPVDVIHATSAAVPPRRAPLVVTVHDLAFFHFPDHATRAGQRFFERSWKVVSREADLVLCPSEATADDCVAHGLDRSRLRVVPWGVHAPPVTDAQVAAVRRRHQLPDEMILFVGTIEPRKNLRRLVDAVAGLGPEAPPLVVAGPAGWDDGFAAAVAPLGDRVRLLGRVPDGELAALYAAATVFAWPSLLEGFGLPVLEAMAQGAAVVTAAGTATAEVAADAAVLVDPADTGAIGDAIASLLSDTAERQRLGEAARRRAATYTWERAAAATVDAYREVAA